MPPEVKHESIVSMIKHPWKYYILILEWLTKFGTIFLVKNSGELAPIRSPQFQNEIY